MDLNIVDNIYVRPLLPVDTNNITRMESEEFFFDINGHPWGKETLAEIMNQPHTGGLAVELFQKDRSRLGYKKQFCGYLIYTFEEGCSIIQRIAVCPQGKGIGFFLMNSFEQNLPNKDGFELLVALKGTDERSQEAFGAWGFEEGEVMDTELTGEEDLGVYIEFSKLMKKEDYA